MICRSCYQLIPQDAEKCPACGNRKVYALGGIPPAELDAFKLRYAENTHAPYDVSAEKKVVASVKRNEWGALFGGDDGLYRTRRGKVREGRNVMHYFLSEDILTGGALTNGRKVYLPVGQVGGGGANGLRILSLPSPSSWEEPSDEFLPLPGRPEPGAVLFGNFLVLVLACAGRVQTTRRVAVVNLVNRTFLGFLTRDDGKVYESIVTTEALPRLITDEKNCALCVLGENVMLGFDFTGSQYAVPFKFAFSRAYPLGGAFRKAAFQGGELFLSLYHDTARTEDRRRTIFQASLSRDASGRYRADFDGDPVYTGGSVLALFLSENKLYWLTLDNEALVLRACLPLEARDVLTGMRKAVPPLTVLHECRYFNTVDAVRFDGGELTVFGHFGNGTDVRRVTAVCGKDGIENVPEEVLLQEAETPFYRVETREGGRREDIPCPKRLFTQSVDLEVVNRRVVDIRRVN